MSRLEPASMSHDISRPEPGPRQLGLSTVSVHAGEVRGESRRLADRPDLGAATFTFSDTQSLLDYVAQKQPREEYARDGNPSHGPPSGAGHPGRGRGRVLFGSGMAALGGCCWA